MQVRQRHRRLRSARCSGVYTLMHLRLRSSCRWCSRSACGCRTRGRSTRCWTSCATSPSPYLRIFRRLGLQFGPLDLSPIVAIIVLQIVGRLIVGLIAPVSAPPRRSCRAALVAVAVVALDQVDQGDRARRRSRAARQVDADPRACKLDQHAQHRRRVQHVLRRRRPLIVIVALRRAGRAAGVLRHAPAAGRWSGCRPACCSAARPAT